MNYKKFSTENADYQMLPANHIHTDISNMVKNLEYLDGIIFESSGISGTIPITDECSKFIRKVKNSKKKFPFYFVDVDLNLGGYLTSIGIMGIQGGIAYKLCKSSEKNYKRREFLKQGLKILTCSLILGGFFEKVLNQFMEVPILKESEMVLDRLPPTPLFELRNAIAARKIEEFIAPRLKIIIPKPTIGIVYGAGHSGIELDLKHKSLRDLVIESYKKINYLGIKKEKLNLILEFNPKSKMLYRHHINLF
ncbi:MAG: hypothetical protein KKB39_04345 [Nanoarchaeota archaeon]|nr:hypothetical protein [Nanoarchaeota archaeon]